MRGTIIVEAIVVVSFFVLCFFGLTYFRALYVRKLESQRLARAAALTHAMGGCASNPRTAIEADLGDLRYEERSASGIAFDTLPSGGSDRGSVGLQKIREKNGDTGLDKVTSVTLTSVTPTDAVGATKSPAASEPSFRGDVASTSFVLCGDPTTDDGYEGMAAQIAKLF